MKQDDDVGENRRVVAEHGILAGTSVGTNHEHVDWALHVGRRLEAVAVGILEFDTVSRNLVTEIYRNDADHGEGCAHNGSKTLECQAPKS